jgi:hypothetical protein
MPRLTTERETLVRFKEILDEALAGVLYPRITMLFARRFGERAERINRTDFGNGG